MKMVNLFAALALTGAVAPPKISLSLEGMTSSYRLDKPIYRQLPKGKMSRQDWTEKCPAKRFCPESDVSPDGSAVKCEKNPSAWVYTSEANCPFPRAAAYDHQDKNVEVSTRIYLIDTDGDGVEKQVKSVDFTKRSTYLFKYDASDNHGNDAEQVVFALILDDANKPFYKMACKNEASAYSNGVFMPKIEVETLSDWKLCQADAFDNYDTLSSSDVKYSVRYEGLHKPAFGNRASGTFKAQEEYKGSNSAWMSYKNALAQFKDGPNGEGPTHVGNFIVVTKVSDNAGVYGHNAVNNVAQRKQEIKVVDNKKPVIYLAGSDPSFAECSKHDMPQKIEGSALEYIAWKGAGAECSDSLDTEALGDFLPVTTTSAAGTTFSAGSDEATYYKPIADEVRTLPDVPRTSRVFKYECSDYAGNKAALRTRTITTVDSTAPTLTLTDNGVETPGETTVVEYIAHTSQSQSINLSAYSANAEDSCDSSITNDDVTTTWGPRPFNPNALGDYVRTYSVTDASGNTARKTRTFTVVDTAIPVIKPVAFARGAELLTTFEASRSKVYTDKGATCSDFVDGELSHAVEVSGEVVNMRIPGTYKIRYDCQDLSGNNAVTRYRTVVVEDTTKPKLKLIGTKVNYVESGFPYVDAGAIASDSLDGDITQYVWSNGATVNVGAYLNNKKSCQAINDAYCHEGRCTSKLHAPSGRYTVVNRGRHVPVNCFFYASTANQQVKGFTYHVHLNSKPKCSEYGMDKFSKKVAGYKYLVEHLKEMHPRLRIGNLDDYVCYQKDSQSLTQQQQGSDDRSYNVKGLHDTLTARVGKYVINYHVSDKAGNRALEIKRTVIVKDTLPPVITLHLKNKLVHNGGVDANNVPKELGLNHKRVGGFEKAQYPLTRKSWSAVSDADPKKSGKSVEANPVQKFPQQYNPAAYKIDDARYTNVPGYKGFGNPNIGAYHYMGLMAEAATTNGWMMGAIASAVAGVALLGYSSRKSVTSVPV